MKRIGEKLKLRCIQDMTPHWGNEFTVDNFYDGDITSHKRRLITKPKEYWDATSVIAQSVKWVRKGYREDTMKEVIPNYITYREKIEYFTEYIEVPLINVISETGRTYSFCLTDKKEFSEIYNIDDVKFTTSFRYANEYFEDIQKIRNDILKMLLNTK